MEEALCFGWIDSLVKKVDEDRYIQKFIPRKRGNAWSLLNRKRAQKMIKLGRITAAGLEKIEEAKRTGSWYKPNAVNELGNIPPDRAKALSSDREARKNFQKMTPTSKKQFLWWIENAKRTETRNKRIEMTVKLTSKIKT